MVVLLLAISAHEAAHAWMSYKFGDDTAYLLGRITLNPVAHTHPIGTLLIPIMMFILAHINSPLAAIPLIGWGKPTPVNPLRWRNKDVANIMVSIAGILANLLLALIAFVILKIIKAIRANNRFARIPAIDTMMFATSLLRQRSGFTGVGLPQPISGMAASGLLMWARMNIMIGINSVPIGCVCATGFNVIRPNRYAVSSPNL